MKTLITHAVAVAAWAIAANTGYGQALKVSLDGIVTAADNYSGMETVEFYNGHDSSTYGTFANQSFTTQIRYGVAQKAGETTGQQYFFMYAEVPLYAKNMVWGAGMTSEEVAQYGKRLDFGEATGSEKFIFMTSSGSELFTVDFGAAPPLGNGGQTDYGTAGLGLIAFKDSVSYLLENNLATSGKSGSSDFHNMTMSVEMQFALDPTKNNQLIQAARNGINVHLSPDRGLTSIVPEPSTTLLLGFLSVAGLVRRRR